MEDDHHHMSRPIINKFVIRQSIKELQSTRVFETLEALSEAVVEDLFDDGFSLGPEEKAKVARIVEEEGYTGRFAVDDFLKRKLKNKKWLPVASVVLALGAFFVSATAAAVIEHYVQKPLETGRSSAPVTAIFQIPDKVGDLLAFQVKVTNVSGEPLSNIVLFASAGDVSQQYKVEQLDKGQSRTVSGFLDLASEPEQDLDFVAYLITGDFSLCSESTKVARQPNYVAMANSPKSSRPLADSPQSATLPTASSDPEKATARQNTRNASGRQTASSDRMETSMKPSAPSVASAPAVPARVLAHQQLDSKNEVLRLAGQSDSVSRALLKAYAEAGDPQARRYLDEQTPSGSPTPKTR